MSGDWPKDFLNAMMIILKKKYKEMNCGDHRLIRPISQMEKSLHANLLLVKN